MDSDNIIKLIGGGGALVGALYILAKVLFRIGERMIAAIDRIGQKVDDHTKADIAAQTEVKEAIAGFDAKLEEVLAGRQRLTPIQGVPIVGGGEYSQRLRKP